MKKLLLLPILLLCINSAFSQEKEILAVIDKMFHAMYAADTARMRTCFTPGAVLLTYSFDSKGNPKSKGKNLNEFLYGIGLNGAADMEERIINWQCLIDGGVASIWAPYEFYFEGKFSHCGVNSFQMLQVQGEWKITMITDTRRNKDCLTEDPQKARIDSILNQWHEAAAKADEEAFFGRMTPEAIYIGTDATERWKRDELKEWSKAYFQKESAWDFKPVSRNITMGPGGQIAWFDELLDTWMGTCRSTGIMILVEGDWMINYYHLSVAIPNDKMDGYKLLIEKE